MDNIVMAMIASCLMIMRWDATIAKMSFKVISLKLRLAASRLY